MRTKISLIFLTYFCIETAHAQQVKITPYASNLGYPIDIRHCNDDRLFVADRNGLIRIVNPDRSVRSVPFLDIQDKISSIHSEEGFLGFCFSPMFKANGKFYVCYTTRINDDLYTSIQEYKVSSTDSNVADPTSALTILTLQQPYGNHKGGHIMFGKDGYLYIPTGDGGGSGDPLNNSQNNGRLLGKLLRIDVANSTPSQPYTIPADNPFVNAGTNIRKEIWAYGLRNPWRIGFDRITYDLWISDVGEGRTEEINFQPSNSQGQHNYGWKIVEGTLCFSPSSGCNTAGLVQPIYEYSHDVGRSVIGGNVYRSAQSRDLWGMYIYGDFRGRWIDGLRQDSGVLSGQVIRLLDKINGGPVSFGEDRFGDLYLSLNNNSTLFKVEDSNASAFPKAFILSTPAVNGFLLTAVEGRNLTYQWLLNNSPIAAANKPAHNAIQTGEYKLVVTNQAGRKDTSLAFLLSAALPVSLKDFNVRNVNPNLNEISWKTETEQNNKGFFVERKLLNEPAFQSMLFVPSKAPGGNSNASIEYATYDTLFLTGTIQYRLKQLDLDGEFTYSPVVTVNMNSSMFKISVVPNPARGWFQIVTNKVDQYEYELTDFTGKQVLKNVFNGSEHRIAVGTLNKGVYLLKVKSQKTGKVEIIRIYIENN